MKLNLKNWSFMRLLRLVLSFGFMTAFATQNDWFLFYIAIFFLVQAIFNVGCGGASCGIPEQETKAEKSV
jgi:hypothetical protein